MIRFDFRWAVSAVSTRQNNILNSRGEPQLALIPVMDFLNHQNGREGIHYDSNLGQIECRTTKDIRENEQIFIFYGKRTNAEYLIHNGFVPNDVNPNDAYLLKLGNLNFIICFLLLQDLFSDIEN